MTPIDVNENHNEVRFNPDGTINMDEVNTEYYNPHKYLGRKSN